MTEEVSKYRVGEATEKPDRVPFWRRRHGSRAPIASRLARKLTGLEFALEFDAEPVRRGGAVKGRLTVTKRRGRLGNVEVGLVCVESYDVETTTYVNNRTQRSRTTKRATAHEQWLPFEAKAGEQEISFMVPGSAPFTYHGKALSFDWQVRAVSRAALRPDAAAHWEVAVLP